MRVRILGIVLSIILLPGIASAQSLETTLQSFGLLGRWAVDCGKPASSDNPYGIYSMIDKDSADLTYDFGPQWKPHKNTINFARALDANRLRINHLDHSDNTSMETVIVKSGNRVQNYSAVQSDGKVIIENGVYTANGQPAVWLNRCP
jgi:hypothetical protein